MRALFHLLAMPLAALLGAPVPAGDYWVDALAGDDANPGTQALPWRTITHALGTIVVPPPGANETVHVLPGVYDSALGESFPLALSPGQRLVGEAGPALTILDGDGTTSPLIELFADWSGPSGDYGPDTLVQGLTLRDAANGIHAESIGRSMSFTISDVFVSGTSASGVGLGSYGSGSMQAELHRLQITECLEGVRGVANYGSQMLVRLVECSVDRCADDGVKASSIQPFGEICRFELIRSSVTNCGGDGVEGYFDFGGLVEILAEDSILAGNAGDGLFGFPWGYKGFSVSSTLRRCTVAFNGGAGVRADGLGGFPHPTVLEGTILWGNGDDIADDPIAPQVTASYCDIGDGDFGTAAGNFSADPLFLAPLTGDYRLRFGSPCVDTGDPATPAGAPDLAGHLRPVDGDLDGDERADVGALELATLDLSAPPVLGTSVDVEALGPVGAPVLLHFSYGLPLATPITTPLGDLDLDLASVVYLGWFPADAGPPGSVQWPITSNPAQLGKSISFQALTPGGFEWPPAATTNPVPVTFLP
jgi:hypothetical protein